MKPWIRIRNPDPQLEKMLFSDPQPWLQDLGPEAWQQLGQHGVQEADFHFREFRSAQRRYF
jgi:hypothetical protein